MVGLSSQVMVSTFSVVVSLYPSQKKSIFFSGFVATFRIMKLLEDKVQAGELGMSVGKGFRSWTPKKAEKAREKLQKYLVEAAKNRLKIRRV